MPSLLPRLAAPLSLCLFTSAAIAQQIADPIPERIAKSDVRIELQPVAKGLASPLLVVPAPDKSRRLFVVDQMGLVRVISDGALVEEPFLDLTARLAKLNEGFDERGLLGLAFDPGFNDPQSPGHRRFFIYTSEPAAGQADFPNPHGAKRSDHHSVIASWKVTAADPARVDMESRQELMRIEQPQFNHNGGMIEFGPDGLLYIGLGDGGAANDLGPGHNPEIGNAQDPQVVLGKMLRIDVNGTNAKNGRYGIPAENPFVKGGALPEIYAMGLRNPYRFSFNNGELLAGDVGQNKLEFLHRVERGGNYGWRIKEGTFKFNKDGTIEAPGDDLPKGLTDPILQYDRDEGTSIIGGYVYGGRAIPQLKGQYVFGDYRNARSLSGRLFHSDLKSGKLFEVRIGSDDREVGFLVKGFGVDHDGELYVTGSAAPGPTGTSGVVMKIVPAAK